MPGDILFVTKGSPGRTCLAPDPIDFCIAQDMVAVRPDESKIDPKYLFSILRTPAIQSEIERLHVGSLIPHFKKGDFDKLLLPVPNRSLQNFIGDLYFTLSKKIELNRRMNETLEGIARAIFQSWFVDFDPVHAKAAGRRPEGMDDETAALFPSEFEESEFGLVPKGWESRSLDGIGHFLNGLALQKYPPTGVDDLAVVKIAQLRRNSVEGADHANSSVPEKYVVKDGDMLFSWSGSLEIRRWSGGPGALNQHLFKATSSDFPNWFLFQWIQEHLPSFRRIAAAKATTMGHIQRHHLTEAFVAVPPPGLLEAASETMQPLFDEALLLDIQSRTLASVRDALLPKLLSGELRIKDAEEFVKARQ